MFFSQFRDTSPPSPAWYVISLIGALAFSLMDSRFCRSSFRFPSRSFAPRTRVASSGDKATSSGWHSKTRAPIPEMDPRTGSAELSHIWRFPFSALLDRRKPQRSGLERPGASKFSAATKDFAGHQAVEMWPIDRLRPYERNSRRPPSRSDKSGRRSASGGGPCQSWRRMVGWYLLVMVA